LIFSETMESVPDTFESLPALDAMTRNACLAELMRRGNSAIRLSASKAELQSAVLDSRKRKWPEQQGKYQTPFVYMGYVTKPDRRIG
jgi:hypothetical protein